MIQAVDSELNKQLDSEFSKKVIQNNGWLFLMPKFKTSSKTKKKKIKNKQNKEQLYAFICFASIAFGYPNTLAGGEIRPLTPMKNR